MITLYTAPTGNGYRASIMLEEVGLAYDVRRLDFAGGDFQSEAFLKVNPCGQIPAITDSEGPDGAPYSLAESMAILQYLAEKTGRLLPVTALERAEAARWAAIIASGIGAELFSIFMMRKFDAAGHAPMIEKASSDLARHLKVMQSRLAASTYLAGETFTYVDIAGITSIAQTMPALGLSLEAYPAIQRWRDAVLARPAVERGRKVPA
jgi:GST-like protein